MTASMARDVNLRRESHKTNASKWMFMCNRCDVRLDCDTPCMIFNFEIIMSMG